ncbi:MAG: DUF1134 domain-containing protein [Hyphomicrobium sp.]
MFRRLSPRWLSTPLAATLAALTLLAAAPAARAVDDAYRPDEVMPAPDTFQGDSGGGETYQPDNAAPRRNDSYRPLDGTRRAARPEAGQDPSGYGEPYVDAPANPREERYEPVPPADAGGPPSDDSSPYYSQSEIVKAGHGFFGNISSGMASAIEWAFQKAGRPNGYILGEDAGGALIAGVRYGEGTLNTKDFGKHKVYWQGPTVGYDVGAEGSKVLVLVYNLRDPSEIYTRFGGVQGAAYLVGGVSVQLQKAGEVTLAPIRSGVGVRLGANVGYLKYTRSPTWNPF